MGVCRDRTYGLLKLYYFWDSSMFRHGYVPVPRWQDQPWSLFIMWFHFPSVGFTFRQSHPSLLPNVEVLVAPLPSLSLKSPGRPSVPDTDNKGLKLNLSGSLDPALIPETIIVSIGLWFSGWLHLGHMPWPEARVESVQPKTYRLGVKEGALLK